MDWRRDLPSWPLHEHSHRILKTQIEWHVQEIGAGPVALLLHGAGASSHSWRDLMPRLGQSYRAIALDLPGQGFSRTRARRRLGLPGMCEDIAALCDAEGWRPNLIIGHSAGAAIALNLARQIKTPEGTAPDIACVNAALGRFEGVAGWLFPALAKLLALNPFTATLFTLGGDKNARARRLIESTGSHLTPSGLSLYARLISDRAHVDATLRMMALWDVDPLLATLPEITNRCLFLVGDRDLAVPPQTSVRAAARMPCARVHHFPSLGHLAHEEAPDEVLHVLLDKAAWPDCPPV